MSGKNALSINSIAAKILGLCGVVIATVAWSNTAQAQSCNVPGDHGDIAGAIADVNCTEIEVDAGLWTTGTLEIDRDLTIAGAGTNLTTIKSNVDTALVLVTNGATGILRDLYLEGSNVTPGQWIGAGVQNAGGTVLIDSTSIKYFEVGVLVGAGTSLVEMVDCSISENELGVDSSYPGSGRILMNRCAIRENTVRGGMDIRSGNISNSTIEDNINEYGGGGGISITEDATLENVTIRNNNAVLNTQAVLAQTVLPEVGRGGGVYLRGQLAGGQPADGHTVVIRDSSIENNQAGRWGGGIAVLGCSTAQMCQNQPENLANLHLISTSVRDNSAGELGGGIYAMGSAHIEDSVIESNTVEFNSTTGSTWNLFNGGGLYVNLNGALIERTVIRDNFAETSGGGIEYTAESESEVRIINSSIIENKANQRGGGINLSGGLYDARHLFLLNSTVSLNWADFDQDGTGDGGGIAGNSSSDLIVLSSIIGANRDGSPNQGRGNCDGLAVSSIGGVISHAVTSFGGNVFGGQFNTHCPISLSPLASTVLDTTGQPPRLKRPIRDGDTIVLPIAANSPAVDSGFCGELPALQINEPIGVDQRGAERDRVPCDSGAFELP